MESTFKFQLHDPDMFDIITDDKYLEGGYKIIDPYKKEDVQQTSK